jgi:hydrogenase maturation protease
MPMNPTPTRCLILACGNTLRGDDGVGLWLAQWAAERFRAQPWIRVIARPQWMPEMAEDIARAERVIFVDCSLASAPGSVSVSRVQPAAPDAVIASHQLGAPELLVLARELYGLCPKDAVLLVIGAAEVELGESLSAAVKASLPEACARLEELVLDQVRKAAG